MALTLQEAFNGEPKRVVNKFNSRAAAVKWIKQWGVLTKGHVWLLTNGEGDEVSLNLADNRTVKPMGWGFKAPYEAKNGRKATDLSVYVPKTEFRRV